MGKIRFLACLLPVVIAMPVQVQAAMQWSPAPARSGHQGHERNAAKVFLLKEGEGASQVLLKPDLSRSPLAAGQGGVKLVPTGMDNYHALVASRIRGALHETAIRYVYLHGKPSGNSPSLLTAELKSVFEIQPYPLAREHWRYTGGETAGFLLRFRGEPLTGAKVSFTSSNGTSAEFTTDADGYFAFDLPDDFSSVKPGRSGNRPAEFVLSAGYEDGAERFVTTLSSEYFVNPDHWQSLPLGMATAAGGMLLGGLLTFRNLRRKEK